MHGTKIGNHVAKFEPPDLLHLSLRGDLSVEDVQGISAFVRANRAKGSHLVLLADLAELGNVAPEARKVVAHEKTMPLYRGMAMYNATFRTRVLMKLVLGATRLLSDVRTPIRFFQTEAEARHWSNSRRNDIATYRAQRSPASQEYLTIQ